jgi:hypothetical protein
MRNFSLLNNIVPNKWQLDLGIPRHAFE